MTRIKDEVTVQLYGDEVLQDRILFYLEQMTGLACSVQTSKPYTTKKGKEGTYRSVTLTID